MFVPGVGTGLATGYEVGHGVKGVTLQSQAYEVKHQYLVWVFRMEGMLGLTQKFWFWFEWMSFNIHLQKIIVVHSDRTNRAYLNPLNNSRVRS